MHYRSLILKQMKGLAIPAAIVAASTAGLLTAGINAVSGQTLSQPPPATQPGQPVIVPPGQPGQQPAVQPAPPVAAAPVYDTGGPTEITANERFVFVLRGGVLLQYDARNLRLVNQAALAPGANTAVAPESGGFGGQQR